MREAVASTDAQGQSLGERLVRAARLAVAAHLQVSAERAAGMMYGLNGQRLRIGGAGPVASVEHGLVGPALSDSKPFTDGKLPGAAGRE